MIRKRRSPERVLKGDNGDWIFRPFYKDRYSDPCSICILRDPDHLIKYGENGCGLKHMYKTTWTGSAYDNICRRFDTPMFYYIARARRNRKDVNEEVYNWIYSS